MARWTFRRRTRVGRFLHINWSRHRPSVSAHLGPLTANSRGGWRWRGLFGFGLRGRWKP
jgi:hypothetical protein